MRYEFHSKNDFQDILINSFHIFLVSIKWCFNYLHQAVYMGPPSMYLFSIFGIAIKCYLGAVAGETKHK